MIGLPGGWGSRSTSSYAGVAGSLRTPFLGYTEMRIYGTGGGSGCCTAPYSAGGTLFPASKLRLTDIKDGTSNTLLVAEVSDSITLDDNTQADWRPSQDTGYNMGCKIGSPSAGGERPFNTTSIKYPINAGKTLGDAFPANGGSGDASTGIFVNVSSAYPINSAHPGGANALLGDGSVRFLVDQTDLDTLSALATRDDRKVINLP